MSRALSPAELRSPKGGEPYRKARRGRNTRTHRRTRSALVRGRAPMRGSGGKIHGQVLRKHPARPRRERTHRGSRHQSRDAGCTHRRRRPAVSRRVPRGPAGHRASAVGVAGDPARRGAADPAPALGPRVREHLDAGGLAAAGELANDCRRTGSALGRCTGSAPDRYTARAVDRAAAGPRGGGARHALRRSVDPRGAARAPRSGSGPHRRSPALPSVLRHDRRLHVRCGGQNAVKLAPRAGAALHRSLPRRPRLHRRARRVDRSRVVRRRPSGPAVVLVSRPAAALSRRRRSVSLRMPQDGASRRAEAGSRSGDMDRRVPVAGRARRMAAPVYRRDAG